MLIKDLKEYLKNFDDNTTVAISVWNAKGSEYFAPNIPCCPPIKFKSEAGEKVAVIGHFDDNLASRITRPK